MGGGSPRGESTDEFQQVLINQQTLRQLPANVPLYGRVALEELQLHLPDVEALCVLCGVIFFIMVSNTFCFLFLTLRAGVRCSVGVCVLNHGPLLHPGCIVR